MVQKRLKSHEITPRMTMPHLDLSVPNHCWAFRAALAFAFAPATCISVQSDQMFIGCPKL